MSDHANGWQVEYDPPNCCSIALPGQSPIRCSVADLAQLYRAISMVPGVMKLAAEASAKNPMAEIVGRGIGIAVERFMKRPVCREYGEPCGHKSTCVSGRKAAEEHFKKQCENAKKDPAP